MLSEWIFLCDDRVHLDSRRFRLLTCLTVTRTAQASPQPTDATKCTGGQSQSSRHCALGNGPDINVHVVGTSSPLAKGGVIDDPSNKSSLKTCLPTFGKETRGLRVRAHHAPPRMMENRRTTRPWGDIGAESDGHDRDALSVLSRSSPNRNPYITKD